MRYLSTETVPVEKLEPYPGNARVHDEPALDESARTNGQYRSVVARRLEDGTLQLLAGHGTVGAFRRQGAGEVRVEVIEADDTEARRITLADNASYRNAGYDQDALLGLLEAASGDGGLVGTGWTDSAMDDLVRLLEAPDLDALAGEVGEPTDDDRHVIVRVSVDPEVRDRLDRLMKLTQEPEESDAFAGVIAWASTAARGEGLDVEP